MAKKRWAKGARQTGSHRFRRLLPLHGRKNAAWTRRARLSQRESPKRENLGELRRCSAQPPAAQEGGQVLFARNHKIPSRGVDGKGEGRTSSASGME